MDFTVTEERRLLGESLTRLLQDRCDFAARIAAAYEPPYHMPELWQNLTELGLFHAFLSPEDGGIGGSGFDILAAFEPLGHALCPEPVLGQLMALRLLAASGADRAALLDGTRYALALGEPAAPWDIAATQCAAVSTAAGWRLSGSKSLVYGGPMAAKTLIPARANGTIALFAIDTAAASRHDYAMIDGGGASEIMLEETTAALLLEDATTALEDALDWGRLALAAEALGAMEAAFAMLIDYLKTREQFGRPLASFQVLQHRSVDLKIALEQARSITIRAANAMGSDQQSHAVAQMKTLIGQCAHLCAEETIQMQGGIAMTWEYPASHYAKRLTMIDHQLGDADYHLARLSTAATPG